MYNACSLDAEIANHAKTKSPISSFKNGLFNFFIVPKTLVRTCRVNTVGMRLSSSIFNKNGE
jgi:hypothetical protein